jgi:hypothetical protein
MRAGGAGFASSWTTGPRRRASSTTLRTVSNDALVEAAGRRFSTFRRLSSDDRSFGFVERKLIRASRVP